MKKVIKIIFFYFLIGSPLAAPCQVSFTTAVNFVFCSGGGAYCYQSTIANADFNSDGKMDFAVGGNFFGGSSYMGIFKGDGIGGFVLARNLSFGGAIQTAISADFNNDGKPDIATSNYPANIVSIRTGTTGINFPFSLALSYTTGGASISLVNGDFNNDGKIDIATANENTNNISILIGNGLGAFSSSTEFSVGNYPRSLTSADFNGDGKQDLAVGNFGSNNLSILLGNGLGGFSSAVNFPIGSAPESICSADFNGDGKLDLATANENSNTVSILFGNGSGGFGIPTNFSVGLNPNSVISADFNGDGKLDIATANNSSNNISVLISNGVGGFLAAVNFPIGNIPFALSSSDFNGDGLADIAVANNGSDSASVLLNNTITAGIKTLTGIISPIILLSPNPNNGTFKLQIDASTGSAEITNGEIILINSLGQKVHQQKITQGSNEIKTSGLASGLYNYILLEDKQRFGSGKLVFE